MVIIKLIKLTNDAFSYIILSVTGNAVVFRHSFIGLY